ncbi:unnamed protein product [Peniophora sp. CBMAI 1063]|nr:unnamed protein product [Peniophora sp. CBMAI 1063]
MTLTTKFQLPAFQRSTFRLLFLLVPSSLAVPISNTSGIADSDSVDFDLSIEPVPAAATLPFMAPSHVLAPLLPNHGLAVQEALDLFDMFFDFHPSIVARFSA